jgi:hypothetical protein
LLADERGGGRRAFALLQTFAKRLLLGGQGHRVTACGGLADTRMEAQENVSRSPVP